MTKPIDEPLYPTRTRTGKRDDVVKVLTAQPEASDRRIARICAVSRELVRDIRRNLVRKSQIASRHALARVGADGKTYRVTARSKPIDATTL